MTTNSTKVEKKMYIKHNIYKHYSQVVPQKFKQYDHKCLNKMYTRHNTV